VADEAPEEKEKQEMKKIERKLESQTCLHTRNPFKGIVTASETLTARRNNHPINYSKSINYTNTSTT